MAKTKKEAYKEAIRVLKKGSIIPMKPVITTYGKGKNKRFGFHFKPL